MDVRQLLAERFDEPIEIDLGDDDIVTGVVVLLRVSRLTDTNESLTMGVNDSMGGITQYGMVRAAVVNVEHLMTGGLEE